MITRRIVVLTALAVSVGACNGDDDSSTTSTQVASSTGAPSSSTPPSSAPSTSSAPTSSAASWTAPTTSSPPAPTVSTVATAAPTTVGGDIDWRAVVEALGQRRQELYAAPDVSRILEVCGDQTPCFDQLQVQIGDLANKGWHVEGASPYVVLDASVEDFDGESIEASNVVTLIVTVERPTAGGQILDSSGAVVADVEPETSEGVNTQNRTILGRIGPGGLEWRIISQERTGEVPG